METNVLITDGRNSSSDLDQTIEQHFNSNELSPSKKSKKNYKAKRKNFFGTKQSKKLLKGKLPILSNACTTTSEDGLDTRANMLSRNTESEEGEDSTHSTSIPPAQGESSLGSSILEEILSEKKKALFESAEMIEFLQGHIKPS